VSESSTNLLKVRSEAEMNVTMREELLLRRTVTDELKDGGPASGSPSFEGLELKVERDSSTVDSWTRTEVSSKKEKDLDKLRLK
jgi:hypothetical protein